MLNLRRDARSIAGLCRSAIVAVVGTALAVQACGGKAIEVPGADAGQSDGASSTCTPLPGCTSSSTCPASDGCNTCTCTDDTWACSQFICPPPACPDFGPTAGGACTSDGQRCSSPGRCAAQCTCKQGAWSCIAPPCPPPVCPSSQPPAASTCEFGLDNCNYGTGCSAIHCYCGRTPEDSGWNCSPVGCDGGADGIGGE